MKYSRFIRSAMRTTFIFATLTVGPARADDADGKVPELKTFQDWKVGCDNIRRCTAIGLSAAGAFSGHVVVKRGGAAQASLQMSFQVGSEVLFKTPVVLSILVDGAPVPSMSQASWPAVPAAHNMAFVRVELRDADVATLLRHTRDGKTLTLKVTGPGRAPDESTISLAGAAAAFLHMDDTQHRTGTVTALVKPGPAPPSTIPPVPPLPVLQSVVMQIMTPPVELPEGVPPPDLDDCSGLNPPVPDVIRLSPQLELWGVCYVRGRYNEQKTFWIVGGGKVRQASFGVPGGKSWTDSPAVLENAALSEDGRLLESSPRGRGLGDCGADARWAWTGSEFQLAYLAEMDDCKGVSVDDWPVLYTTRWK